MCVLIACVVCTYTLCKPNKKMDNVIFHKKEKDIDIFMNGFYISAVTPRTSSPTSLLRPKLCMKSTICIPSVICGTQFANINYRRMEMPMNVSTNHNDPHPSLSTTEIISQTNHQNIAVKKTLCRDFVWGCCIKYTKCEFRHERNFKEMINIIKFCHDYQRGCCTRERCTYLHACEYDESRFNRTGFIPGVLAQRYQIMAAAETAPHLVPFIQEHFARPRYPLPSHSSPLAPLSTPSPIAPPSPVLPTTSVHHAIYTGSSIDDQESLRGFLEEADLVQYFELFRDILKVNKLSQLKFVALEDLVQIGLSKPEQRRYKQNYSKYFPNAYVTMMNKLFHKNKKKDSFNIDQNDIDIETSCDTNIKVPTKHIISIEDITFNKELGMGQFGVVQQGTWKTGNQRIQVAIKCLGNERVTSNSTEFLKEAAVMHSIEHPNIVRLYGVVLHLESLMLVTELAPLRSLLECLREVSLRCNFSLASLCEFAEQICDGMTYLENKRLIHRDLAARNILVFNKDRVKISDFGLSRALGVGKDYYQTNYNVNLKLPVAWCAPECILYLRFTSSSDVWAFGVCLWEMFTYGFQPWAAFSGQQILESIDAPNYHRLERPECCSDAYYSLMLECWSHEPQSRPKFKDLLPRLIQLRPEEVETFVSYKKPEERLQNNFLKYKAGQRITVVEKVTYTTMWYGALPGGACGMFDPNHVRPISKHEISLPSPHPSRSRSIRSSLLRSDAKRHTCGKRAIQRSMISSPQGDVKHTGHVGLDGAYFGDLSFLDSAGCPPRQIVTPYKPSEDLEQVPLINPNSPSHLTASTSASQYPLLTPRPKDGDDDGEKSKTSKKQHKSCLEPTTSKGLFGKVKNATLGRSHKSEEGSSKNDEVHEYHEISDNENECVVSETKTDFPESPALFKDFSQSLLDEMESIFRNFDSKRGEESTDEDLSLCGFKTSHYQLAYI